MATKKSRSTEWRHRKAALAAQRGEGGLPMPYRGRTSKVTTLMCAEYRARLDRHLAQFPDYARGWERPTPETAQKVYDLVRVHVPDLAVIHSDPITAMQLVTVTLDLAVVSARYGSRVTERHVSDEELLRRIKRTVTKNVLTDAIMRRWSDHARLARTQGRAYALTQMTEPTARDAYSDLLAQYIHVSVLWDEIIKHKEGKDHPLFHVEGASQIGESYDIKLHRGPALRKFERLVQKDTKYAHSRASHAWRLWIVGDDPPLVDHSDPICAEQKYNVVSIGEKTRHVLDIQKGVKLWFDAPRFVADYERVRASERLLGQMITKYQEARDDVRQMAEAHAGHPLPKQRENWSPEERLLRKRKLKMKIFRLEFRSIYDQVRRERAPVLVQSEFCKVLNRRYQNLSFFPMQTSTKKDAPLPDRLHFDKAGFADPDLGWPGAAPDFMRVYWEMVGFSRTRWFSAPGPHGPIPLVEMDVSASQTQIQSILLGLDGMEEDSFGPVPHKQKLAEISWNVRRGGDIKADPAKLTHAIAKINTASRQAMKVAHPDMRGSNEEARRLIERREKDLAKAEAKRTTQITHGAFLPDLIVKGSVSDDPDNPDPVGAVGYAGPDDTRLIERMKSLWMLLGYGPLIQGIIRDQAKDPDVYGPGWRKRPPTTKEKALAEAAGVPPPCHLDVSGITAVLATVPGFIERGQFLDDCKRAVCDLLEANPYEGLTLIDPLDGAEFTWDQPLMAADRLSLHEWQITLLKPGSFRRQEKVGKYLDEDCPKCSKESPLDVGRGKLRGSHWRCRKRECGHVWQARFRDAPTKEGKLQVDDEKLRGLLAPCLIHMLDSLFSSLVMEALHRDGVTSIIGIHDCWAIPETVYRTDGREPESGYEVLKRAIKAAGEPWLKALGPVYEWLIDHKVGRGLAGHGQIEEAYRKWENRVRDEGWPEFFAVPGKRDEPSLAVPAVP